MVIVIDTNVIIDAWRDDFAYPRKIVDEVITGNIRAVASHKIWREYELILNRLVNDDGHRELADRFVSAVEMVNSGPRVNIVKYDKEDNKFFSAALAGKADYIISNDMDLREVGEYRGVEVKTPEDFWLEYKRSKDESGSEEWKKWMGGIMNK